MRVDVAVRHRRARPRVIVPGRVVAVIDVLRASTTIATALANGARCVDPVRERRRGHRCARSSSSARDVRLAGERHMLPVSGFDLGNSPRDVHARGRRGQARCCSRRRTARRRSSRRRARATCRRVVRQPQGRARRSSARPRAAASDVALVCAGRERHFALEDAACAGRLVRGLDAAATPSWCRTTPPRRARCSTAATAIGSTGCSPTRSTGARWRRRASRADLDDCAQVDAQSVVPIYFDRQITKLGPERER